VLYEPLEKNDTGALPNTREPPSSQLANLDFRINLWTLLAGILATTTVVLLALLYRQQASLSYEHGFATELGLICFLLVDVLKSNHANISTASARSAVELVNLQFTGELAVTENGT